MLSFFRKKQSDSDLISKGAIRSVFVEQNVSLNTVFFLFSCCALCYCLFTFSFKEYFNQSLVEMGYENEEDLKQTIYDHLRTIRDPEKPSTLEVN